MLKADTATAVNPFRQNIQAEYVDMLIRGAGLLDDKKSPYTYAGQAAALSQLMAIRTQIATALPVADASTKAHRQAIAFRINRAMKK